MISWENTILCLTFWANLSCLLWIYHDQAIESLVGLLTGVLLKYKQVQHCLRNWLLLQKMLKLCLTATAIALVAAQERCCMPSEFEVRVFSVTGLVSDGNPQSLTVSIQHNVCTSLSHSDILRYACTVSSDKRDRLFRYLKQQSWHILKYSK